MFSIHYYNQWTMIAIKFLIIAIFDANDQSFVLITIHKSQKKINEKIVDMIRQNTPPRPSEISEKNLSTQAKSFL